MGHELVSVQAKKYLNSIKHSPARDESNLYSIKVHQEQQFSFNFGVSKIDHFGMAIDNRSTLKKLQEAVERRLADHFE